MCNGYLPLESFSVNRAQQSGRHTVCKACDRAKNANPIWRRNRIDRQMQRRYGITLDEREAMEDRQGGVCAICHRPETQRNPQGGIKALSIDHCHATGAVRGLLCSECNTGLGRFQDCSDRLRSAARYLEEHGG